MPMNEQETRFALIDPELRSKGWDYTIGTLRLETTLGANGFDDNGKPCKLNAGRSDYLLRIKTSNIAQPIAIAFIEAKKRNSAVTKGLDQAIKYARYHHVSFVYSCNGDQFIEYNCLTGITSLSQSMAEFPSHNDLLARYQSLNADKQTLHSKVLSIPYSVQESEAIRYYQDAAIRAILEKIPQCEHEQKPKRAFLSLATGTGKTRLATNLLKRISEAGLLEKALFICDRDELRTQGHEALSRLFSSNAQMVDGSNARKNAKVLVATYQTLGVEDEDKTSFLIENYPENYFSHIVIDECHRSGFGKWSAVLTRNPDAVQIGLTATPRKIKTSEMESEEDDKISADNYLHFGDPVYEYDLLQAVEDGYLSACEIIQNHVLLLGEQENKGLLKEQLINTQVKNYFSGQELTPAALKEKYHAVDLDSQIILPERTQALCSSLFSYLLATGKPEQKTIIFCAGVDHAQRVAKDLRNLYADWCKENQQDRLDMFAFPCTGTEGKEHLTDFKEAKRSHFIACTADLLQAGVDVPWVRNIVFFTYLQSAIRFYQMVGRGTRLHAETEKISFKVYDYTNATRLFGEEFLSKFSQPKQTQLPKEDDKDKNTNQVNEKESVYKVEVSRVEPLVEFVGRYFLLTKDSKHTKVTFAEYREYVKGLILQRLPTVEAFVQEWVDNPNDLLAISELQNVLKHKQDDYDSFDVIAELAYQVEAKTKPQRVADFLTQSESWLVAMPQQSANTLRALGDEFQKAGTEGLNNKELFSVRSIINASGGSPYKALKLVGNPNEMVKEFKKRIFTLNT